MPINDNIHGRLGLPPGDPLRVPTGDERRMKEVLKEWASLGKKLDALGKAENNELEALWDIAKILERIEKQQKAMLRELRLINADFGQEVSDRSD